MTFEGSVADVHLLATLLVGAPFADKAQNLVLTWRQRLPKSLNPCLSILARIVEPRPPSDDFATMRYGSFGLQWRIEKLGDTAYQEANAFRFAKRIFHDLLQGLTVASRSGDLVAMLAEIADIKQQSRQRSVEFMRYRGSHFVHRPHMFRRGVADFDLVSPQFTEITLCHCIESPLKGLS